MFATLAQVSLQLTRIGLPVIIFASVMGNTLNIAVLTRTALRHHACSYYFIALSTNNLIYSGTILIVSLLGDGFQIRLAIASSVSCKLITYFGTLLSALSPSFIVLASIDRWFASSISIQHRKFSSVRVAQWSIIIVTLFFSLFFIPSLILSDVQKSDTLGCHIRGNSVYIQAYGIIQFIVFACLAPCLMSLFGCMTIYNVQRHRMITSTLSSYRRTEGQLARMLLFQVGTQIVLILPLCVLDLLLTFPAIYQPTTSFYSIFMICQDLFEVSYTTPFFLYVLSSRFYRKELVKLIFKMASHHGKIRVHPITSTRPPISVQTRQQVKLNRN